MAKKTPLKTPQNYPGNLKNPPKTPLKPLWIFSPDKKMPRPRFTWAGLKVGVKVGLKVPKVNFMTFGNYPIYKPISPSSSQVISW